MKRFKEEVCLEHNYIISSTQEDLVRGTVRFKCSVCNWSYIRKELKGENYSGQNQS